jgi:CBS domain containing-hemolysin-like protein
MTKPFSLLPTVHLHAGVTYFHPLELPEVLHWEDAALHAMVDFKYTKPETIRPDESLDTALNAIANCSYHALLVVNHEGNVLGLVSAEDLLGEKPLKVIQERHIPRADIPVQLMMIPQAAILTIDVEHLRHAKVGHIIRTLQAHKQHFALIVKMEEGNSHIQKIRGLFSLSLLSKQLGYDVTSDLAEAHSIVELQYNLHLHD